MPHVEEMSNIEFRMSNVEGKQEGIYFDIRYSTFTIRYFKRESSFF
jgi:hypothetical protein